MSHLIRRSALAAACAASLLLGLVATPALATHFQRESYPELLAQLHHREVVAVVLHPQGYKAHASLANGGHITVTYTPAEVQLLRSAATAGGSSFAIATSKPKVAVHHKLRYIAGGVLIVVIVVVLVVLLVGRRRTLEDEGPYQGGEAASSPPPAGSG
jgi:tRNA A37 threonylcarbamoyltransferase TsaD